MFMLLCAIQRSDHIEEFVFIIMVQGFALIALLSYLAFKDRY